MTFKIEMEKDLPIHKKILGLQDSIVNQSFIFLRIIAIINLFLTLWRVSFLGLDATKIAQIILCSSFIVISFFSKRISILIKVNIFIAFNIAMLLIGFNTFGLFAIAKYFVLFSCFFVSFIFSYKKTILIYTSFAICYLLFAVLYCTETIEYKVNVMLYIKHPMAWFIDFFILFGVTLILIWVSYKFKGTILENYTQIEKQNSELENLRDHLELLVKERTDELETVNEELRSLNDEIFEKNRTINLQNNELKVAISNLQETQMQLMQTDKMASLGVLTAGVAHEINNPLNFIVGGLTGLEDYFSSSEINHPEEVTLLLNSIKTGIDRTSAIVTSLNQFSRDNRQLNELYDIHSILENCLVMLHNKTMYRIGIRKDFFTESVSMVGNVGKMHQVFINILYNAVQAIENEGIITIKTQKRADAIVVEISDTGCGISSENLSKITDPFYTTKAPGVGTGLGLSITYSIIQEHRGNITFQSTVNEGTTVKITLPTNS